MQVILFWSHFLGLAIEQIHVIVIAFVYLEHTQISSSKSIRQACMQYSLFILGQPRTKLYTAISRRGTRAVNLYFTYTAKWWTKGGWKTVLHQVLTASIQLDVTGGLSAAGNFNHSHCKRNKHQNSCVSICMEIIKTGNKNQKGGCGPGGVDECGLIFSNSGW